MTPKFLKKMDEIEIISYWENSVTSQQLCHRLCNQIYMTTKTMLASFAKILQLVHLQNLSITIMTSLRKSLG